MAESTALDVIRNNEVALGDKGAHGIQIITKAEARTRELMDKYGLLMVADDQGKVAGEKATVEIGDAIKEVDAERKAWSDPYYRIFTVFNAVVKDICTDPLTRLKADITRSVQDYNTTQQRKQQAEQLKAAEAEIARAKEAQARGETVDIPDVVVSATKPREVPQASEVAYRRKWLYEVVDESKLPKDYTMTVPNHAAITAAVQAGVYNKPGEKLSSNRTQIPGVRIWAEDKPGKNPHAR